jgi:hypothetical protein
MACKNFRIADHGEVSPDPNFEASIPYYVCGVETPAAEDDNQNSEPSVGALRVDASPPQSPHYDSARERPGRAGDTTTTGDSSRTARATGTAGSRPLDNSSDAANGAAQRTDASRQTPDQNVADPQTRSRSDSTARDARSGPGPAAHAPSHPAQHTHTAPHGTASSGGWGAARTGAGVGHLHCESRDISPQRHPSSRTALLRGRRAAMAKQARPSLSGYWISLPSGRKYAVCAAALGGPARRRDHPQDAGAPAGPPRAHSAGGRADDFRVTVDSRLLMARYAAVGPALASQAARSDTLRPVGAPAEQAAPPTAPLADGNAAGDAALAAPASPCDSDPSQPGGRGSDVSPGPASPDGGGAGPGAPAGETAGDGDDGSTWAGFRRAFLFAEVSKLAWYCAPSIREEDAADPDGASMLLSDLLRLGAACLKVVWPPGDFTERAAAKRVSELLRRHMPPFLTAVTAVDFETFSAIMTDMACAALPNARLRDQLVWLAKVPAPPSPLSPALAIRGPARPSRHASCAAAPQRQR